MDRKQMCVSNVKYKKPTQNEAKRMKNLLGYLAYRDSRDDYVPQRFFPPSAMRPALHLAGTYGSGKSELAALMSSFYGRFDRDSPPAQWGEAARSRHTAR